MSKTSYSSGFLYNSKSHQILLVQSQQENSAKPLWSMLGGECREEEESTAAFQRIINQALNLDVKAKNIFPIYDYFHETLEKINYVFYAEVNNSKIFNTLENGTLSWLTFSETLKLLFSHHTKQDIIVGERVIGLKNRLAQNVQFNNLQNPS